MLYSLMQDRWKYRKSVGSAVEFIGKDQSEEETQMTT